MDKDYSILVMLNNNSIARLDHIPNADDIISLGEDGNYRVENVKHSYRLGPENTIPKTYKIYQVQVFVRKSNF